MPAVGVGRRRIIKRPRLTRMLDESNARIILLVAPAGYGKTTLAHEWLDEKRAVWYRAGPASADVAALAAGVASACAEIVPGAGNRMRQRLRATDRPEEDARLLAEMLAEDLAEWPDDAWLAIDDYHFAMESEATEEFVAALPESTPVGLFVTARRRPFWATARRRVYGEIFELSQVGLAMSDDEAVEVLASTKDATEFLRRAAGWPAVIGLAALADNSVMPGESFTTSLSDYFAQELYNAAEPGVRWALCQLAIAPSITSELAQFLFGEDTARLVLGHAGQLGVLTRTDLSGFELHPLVREFLEGQALEYGDASLKRLVDAMGEFLIDAKRWDDAFALAERFVSRGLLLDLVQAAGAEILAEGRLATLERWLAYASDQRIQSPFLDITAAEVAFRRGLHQEAETLAIQATHSRSPALSVGDMSRAYSVAGHSAHLANHEIDALHHYQHAEQTAADVRQLRDALWGQLLCALDLDRPDADAALNRLESVGAETANDSLRLGTGKLILALRQGTGVEVDEVSERVVARATDPLVRSSFLNAWVFALVFSGRYSEALKASQLQLAEANQYRLAFALPTAYLSRGLAFRGVRDFRQAHGWFDKAEEAMDIKRGVTPVQIARALSLLAEDRSTDAVDLLRTPPPQFATQSLRSEYLASLALALSTTGAFDDSLGLARQALAGPTSVEAGVLVACTRATVAIRRGSLEARALAQAAFETGTRTGNLDSFVSAYRAVPELAACVAETDSARYELNLLMARAMDYSLATTLGLDRLPRRTSASNPRLSPRENDVYELVAQGLSNRDIAKTLFLSESTVKIHVRRILEKLGVQTRTQAALLAAKERET